MEMDVLEADLEWVKNPKYHTKELKVRGNMAIKKPKLVKRK